MEGIENKGMVSVIMATYNRRDNSIGRALESIIKQSYKNLELIVINDGGECVLDIIKAIGFRDEELKYMYYGIDRGVFKYISNETNQGLFRALNSGLKIVSGEYITFLDDDDTFLPDGIKDMVSGFTDDSIKAVYANTIYHRGCMGLGISVYPNEDVLKKDPDSLYERNCMVNCSRMFRREVFDQIGVFNPYYKVIGDWEFNLRCHLKFGFAYINKSVSQVFMHEGSMSLDKDKMKEEYKYIMKNHAKN